MANENPEVALFQNWFWGRLHPQEFALLYAPVDYRAIALFAGVSASTVEHYLQSAAASSYREPSSRVQRLLCLAHWWLDTFEQEPNWVLAQFEQQRHQ
jgi:hypothetical protein